MLTAIFRYLSTYTLCTAALCTETKKALPLDTRDVTSYGRLQLTLLEGHT